MNNKETSPLGRAISHIRWRLRLSQTALGVTVHADQPQISRYESGARVPPAKTLVALLSLAQTPEERIPISDAVLRQRKPRGKRNAPSLSSFLGSRVGAPSHSIAPPLESGNV